MNEQWMEQLRQKMADYQQPAPEVSWEEIDRVLAANKTRMARQRWLLRMAAAAVILLIAGVGYWRLLPNETEQIIENPVTQGLPTDNHGDLRNDGSAAKRERLSAQGDASLSCRRGPKRSVATVHESETVTPVSMAEQDTVNTAPAANEQAHVVEEKAKPADRNRTQQVVYPSDLRQRKHLSNRLTAKAYISSTMTNSHQTESFSKRWSEILIIGNDSPDEKALSTYAGGETGGLMPSIIDTITVDMSMQADQQVHHRQPVRFGLSLRYQLDERWSVESGLTYTRLSSDITTTVDGVATTTELRLNYLGLPLNVSYSLWKNRYFGLYVTAGGMIEKSLDTSPWQFSLNGAAGAEYRLTDIFSLYAEPGLGYYFKDGSSTPTIYQDHPLNFNLSLGLRFNLK